MKHLIELVRGRPLLWDCTLEDYRDNVLKDKAWEEVANIVNQDKKTVRQRWKKLRDCHRQALQRRKPTAGQAAAKIKKWKFEDQMQFLIKTMAHRPSDSSVLNPIDDVAVNNDDDEEVEDEDAAAAAAVASGDETELQPEHIADPVSTSRNLSHQVRENRQRPLKGADGIISFMREKCETLDDIDLFFASAAQSVRRLPRRLQNKVKIDLMSSIAAAEEESEWHDCSVGQTSSPVTFQPCCAPSADASTGRVEKPSPSGSLSSSMKSPKDEYSHFNS